MELDVVFVFVEEIENKDLNEFDLVRSCKRTPEQPM